MAKKRKRYKTKVATANLPRRMGMKATFNALDALINQGAAVIGLQEISDRSRFKTVRRYLARQGFGMVYADDVPIAYSLKRYKKVDSGKRKFTKFQSGFNPARYGNWVALRDRRTGRINVVTNTHFTAGHSLSARRYRREQARDMARLQRDLLKRYGRGANYFLMGDFNDHLPTRLKVGQLDRVTSDRIDRIYSERRAIRVRRLKNRSDHDALLGTFYAGTKKKKKKGGKGGHPSHDPDVPKPPKGDEDDVPISAFELFRDLLESWGIPVGSDIEKIIRQAVLDGITPDQIGLLIPEIQQTESWKTRFPGWHQRVQNGFNQLTVDEYLNLEDAYHRILQEAGLPAGFYDDPSDFGNWIANNVSPDEVQNRVALAVRTAQQIDPTARNLMARFYGLSTGDIAAYFLDQQRALPVIERQFNAANVAAWAAKAGFEVTNMGRYEELVDAGITPEQAATAYGTVKSLSDTVGRIASVYGEEFGQREAEEDVFFGRDEQRRRLVSREAATFAGRSRGATGSAQRPSY